MFRNLLGGLFGGGATESHYRREADRSQGLFRDLDSGPDDGGQDEAQEPNIEVVDFGGASSDIEWMTYNHDTGEAIIRFLEHGELTDHAHAYSYPGFPYEEFEALRLGAGPFPRNRFPYYQKVESAGQRANYYLRNDQRDDLHEYERIDDTLLQEPQP